MKNRPLTKEYLNSLLDYDPGTGVLRWKEIAVSHHSHKTRNKVFAGAVAGSFISNNGKPIRITVGIDGHPRKAHRLIFVMMGVDVPEGMTIDHKDRNPWNNKWSNLRIATSQENHRNVSARNGSITGMLGVYQIHRYGKTRYRASFKIDGKIQSKEFDSKVDAAVQRDLWSIKGFGEFASLNFPRSLYYLRA